jgi:hypothetical protein
MVEPAGILPSHTPGMATPEFAPVLLYCHTYNNSPVVVFTVAVTRVLIGFALFLQKNGLWFVPLSFTTVGSIFYFVFNNEKTKFIGEAIIYSIPGIKTMLMQASQYQQV